jgi:MGT family glycosyltransferase
MSRYLFAMWDGGGAVAPELGVARRLISRGHEVRVIADPTLRDEALGIGAEFAPWVAAPHRTGTDPAEDLVKDWEVRSPFEGLRRMRDRLIGGPAGRGASDTAEQIAAYSPDALVADYFLFGAMIAAQGAGLPLAALMPNIWALPVRGVPPIAAGFPLAKGPLGRARDAALVALVNRVFAKGLPSLNATRAAYGLPPLTSFYDQVLTADRILVLTSPAFDYAAPFVPANARYVGPILDEPGWAEPRTHPWTDDEQPLVLVGLSSTFQDQATLLRRIIDALSTLPVRAVVTTGPAVDPAGLVASSNVRVVRSAPHGPLIAVAAAVVTHCGHGTTLKSLAAGVPMVCIPMGRDQDDTAARVVHHGAGIRLSPNASAGTIRAAVTTVLEREEYRAAARKLATAITDERGPSTLMTELESLARAGRSVSTDNDPDR